MGDPFSFPSKNTLGTKEISNPARPCEGNLKTRKCFCKVFVISGKYFCICCATRSISPMHTHPRSNKDGLSAVLLWLYEWIELGLPNGRWNCHPNWQELPATTGNPSGASIVGCLAQGAQIMILPSKGMVSRTSVIVFIDRGQYPSFNGRKM